MTEEIERMEIFKKMQPQNSQKQKKSEFDRLDYFSFALIILLSALAGYLAVKAHAYPQSQMEIKHSGNVVQQIYDPQLENNIRLAKNLMNNNLQKCRELLDTMVVSSPYNAEPFMLEGDYFLRMQMPVAAMHSYRKAIDLDLDYLDKKTPMYQGKKIRNTVEEAEKKIHKDLVLHPGDADLLLARKEMRYMKRRIAGSCSG